MSNGLLGTLFLSFHPLLLSRVRAPPHDHAPGSLAPADWPSSLGPRPLFPSPTWLYLLAQLEEAKRGQLLLGLPAH